MSTNRRVCDLVRLAFISAFLGGIFVTFGMYFYDSQGCKDGYFEKDGVECLKCQNYLGDNCMLCDSSSQCTSSKMGTYVIQLGENKGQVEYCARTYDGCLECDAVSCNVCEPGFYLSYGVCKPCNEIEGCIEGQCDQSGCTKCQDGYYKKGQTCSNCRDALRGCAKCADALTCTECASEFLQVDDKG